MATSIIKLISDNQLAVRLGIGYAFVCTHMCRPELNKYRLVDARGKTGVLEYDFEIVKTLLMMYYNRNKIKEDSISEREISVILGVSYNTVHTFNCRIELNKYRLRGHGNGVKRSELTEYLREFKKVYNDSYKRRGRYPRISKEEKETDYGTVCTANGICGA